MRPWPMLEIFNIAALGALVAASAFSVGCVARARQKSRRRSQRGLSAPALSPGKTAAGLLDVSMSELGTARC